MKKQSQDQDITIESIAEQWARLILSQIEARKDEAVSHAKDTITKNS